MSTRTVENPDLRVILLISNNRGGSGLSTTTNLLQHELKTEDRHLISLSNIGRATTAEAISRKLIGGKTAEWEDFADSLKNVGYLDALQETYLDSDVSERDIHDFNKCLQEVSQDHPEVARIIKTLPEEIGYKKLLSILENDHPNTVIVTGKLSILLEEIVGEFPDFGYPILKVLITVEPLIGAERILNRENPSLAQKENQDPDKQIALIKLRQQIDDRVEFDWEQFQSLYNITLYDLYQAANIVIDTSDPNNNPKRVVSFVLDRILAIQN